MPAGYTVTIPGGTLTADYERSIDAKEIVPTKIVSSISTTGSYWSSKIVTDPLSSDSQIGALNLASAYAVQGAIATINAGIKGYPSTSLNNIQLSVKYTVTRGPKFIESITQSPANYAILETYKNGNSRGAVGKQNSCVVAATDTKGEYGSTAFSYSATGTLISDVLKESRIQMLYNTIHALRLEPEAIGTTPEYSNVDIKELSLKIDNIGSTPGQIWIGKNGSGLPSGSSVTNVTMDSTGKYQYVIINNFNSNYAPYYSEDYGNSWTAFRNNPFQISEEYENTNIAIQGSNILVSIEDNLGSYIYSISNSNYESSWTQQLINKSLQPYNGSIRSYSNTFSNTGNYVLTYNNASSCIILAYDNTNSWIDMSFNCSGSYICDNTDAGQHKQGKVILVQADNSNTTISVSTDGGNSFSTINLTSSTSLSICSICMSSTGEKQFVFFAVTNDLGSITEVYISYLSNYGTSWTSPQKIINIPTNNVVVASNCICSSTGQYITLALIGNDYLPGIIYYSTDSGQTWTQSIINGQEIFNTLSLSLAMNNDATYQTIGSLQEDSYQYYICNN